MQKNSLTQVGKTSIEPQTVIYRNIFFNLLFNLLDDFSYSKLVSIHFIKSFSGPIVHANPKDVKPFSYCR